MKAPKSRATKVLIMSSSSSLKDPGLFTRHRQLSQGIRVSHKRIIWLSDSPVSFLAFVLLEFEWCQLYLHMELFLKLCQKPLIYLAFLPLHQLAEWKFSVLQIAEHLNTPSPFPFFCTLGFIVISPLLSLFHSSSDEGSVVTLWDWDCKIRMEMCEMDTSVYHFAISTLHCSFLAAIKTLSYAFICWFAFIFIFIISWVLECFLKAGRASWVSSSYLCLEHICSRSQKCGAREGIELGIRSQGCALALCQQWVVICAEEDSHSLSVGINELWGDQGKVGHHLGSSHHPTSCTTLWLRPKLQCYPSLKLLCRKSQNRK